MSSQKMFRAFCGGRGAGKTKVGTYDLLQRAWKGPKDRHYMVASPDYTMLEDGPIPTFKETIDQLSIPGKFKSSPRPTAVLGNGATILFRSMDDPEKRRGPNLSGVFLDEASLMAIEAFQLAIACLREGGDMGWLSACFTPKGKGHWTYKVFAEPDAEGRKPPNVDLFHSTTKQNVFIAETFEAAMRGQYDATFAEQELGGEFIDLEGTLFHPHLWPRWMDLGNAYKLGRQLVYASDVPIWITVDAASTDKKRSDFTAMMVGGITPEGDLIILEVVNAKWPLKRVIPELALLCQRWRPQLVGIESDNFQEALCTDCSRFQAIPEVFRLKTKGRTKRARATPAVVKAENGHVWLPQAKMPWMDQFAIQVSSFTGLDEREKDDMVDCMAYMVELGHSLGDGAAEDTMGLFVGGRQA